MMGLLYKEFAIQKKNLLIMAAMLLLLSVFLFIPVGSGGGLTGTFFAVYGMVLRIYAFLLISMYQPSIFGFDERKRWAYFITASPVTAKGQVASKYLFTLMLSVFTLIWCFVLNRLSASISGGTQHMTMLLLGMFSIQVFLNALEYPFIVRFGSKNGGNFKTILFIIIFMLVVVYALFGRLPQIASLDEFFEWIVRVASGSAFSKNVKRVIYLSPAVSLLIYWLSCRISCALYLAGAENYEK